MKLPSIKKLFEDVSEYNDVFRVLITLQKTLWGTKGYKYQGTNVDTKKAPIYVFIIHLKDLIQEKTEEGVPIFIDSIEKMQFDLHHEATEKTYIRQIGQHLVEIVILSDREVLVKITTKMTNKEDVNPTFQKIEGIFKKNQTAPAKKTYFVARA